MGRLEGTLVNPDRSAVLICDRGSDNAAVTQEFPYTNFPLESVTIYCQRAVLLLPSEY